MKKNIIVLTLLLIGTTLVFAQRKKTFTQLPTTEKATKAPPFSFILKKVNDITTP